MKATNMFFHARCDRSDTKVTIVYIKIRKMMPRFHFCRYRDDAILNLFVYIFIYLFLTFLSKNHSNNCRSPVFGLWLERVKSTSTIALNVLSSALFFVFFFFFIVSFIQFSICFQFHLMHLML